MAPDNGQRPPIYIVSGPSSVGKSRFLASHRFTEICGAPPETELCVAKDQRLPASGPVAIHYNIQRPLDQLLSRGQRAGSNAHTAVAYATDFSNDLFWSRVLSMNGELQAVVLAADQARLLNRVKQRRTVERSNESYPVDKWLERYSAVEVGVIYRAWLAELESRNIPTVLIDARNDRYRRVCGADELLAIVEGRSVQCTRERVEVTLARETFEYHRVPLPFGLATGGDDRSATRDLVLPPSLEGKSVLDVGCALGYYCFEAEARDASRVMGIEPRESRFQHACLLKDLKSSQVEFVQSDINGLPAEDEWDIVLLLNVIHHLAEPMRALRKLAAIARERFVIEFPTFADPRYRRHRRVRLPSLYNRRPVIGVSSLVKGVDQTFIFSPEAIRALLLEQDMPVRSVEFKSSPIPGRMIAFVTK